MHFLSVCVYGGLRHLNWCADLKFFMSCQMCMGEHVRALCASDAVDAWIYFSSLDQERLVDHKG